METADHTTISKDQEDMQDKVTEQKYSASESMVAQSAAPESDFEQRGGYEMEDCCADSCYCIGFIFTLGLITLCCQPDDMY